MHVYPQKMWKATQKLKEGGFYSPLCWTEESVTAPHNILAEVTDIIEASDGIVLGVRYGGFTVGSLMILLTVYELGRRHKLQNETGKAFRNLDLGINNDDDDDGGGDDDDNEQAQQKEDEREQAREQEQENSRLLGNGPII